MVELHDALRDLQSMVRMDTKTNLTIFLNITLTSASILNLSGIGILTCVGRISTLPGHEVGETTTLFVEDHGKG